MITISITIDTAHWSVEEDNSDTPMDYLTHEITPELRRELYNWLDGTGLRLANIAIGENVP